MTRIGLRVLPVPQGSGGPGQLRLLLAAGGRIQRQFQDHGSPIEGNLGGYPRGTVNLNQTCPDPRISPHIWWQARIARGGASWASAAVAHACSAAARQCPPAAAQDSIGSQTRVRALDLRARAFARLLRSRRRVNRHSRDRGSEARARCRCGRGEPSRGAEVAGVSPAQVQLGRG